GAHWRVADVHASHAGRRRHDGACRPCDWRTGADDSLAGGGRGGTRPAFSADSLGDCAADHPLYVRRGNNAHGHKRGCRAGTDRAEPATRTHQWPLWAVEPVHCVSKKTGIRLGWGAGKREAPAGITMLTQTCEAEVPF